MPSQNDITHIQYNFHDNSNLFSFLKHNESAQTAWRTQTQGSPSANEQQFTSPMKPTCLEESDFMFDSQLVFPNKRQSMETLQRPPFDIRVPPKTSMGYIHQQSGYQLPTFRQTEKAIYDNFMRMRGQKKEKDSIQIEHLDSVQHSIVHAMPLGSTDSESQYRGRQIDLPRVRSHLQDFSNKKKKIHGRRTSQ